MEVPPLVSVVIPTYNRADLICRTIENVFEQSYRNLELVIVDDGSTDDTLEQLSRFGNRLRVLSQPNSGPAVARNRGGQAARGEIIAFQDSDDKWMPNKLERQISLLQKAGPNVPCCLCNSNMYFADDRLTTSFELARMRPSMESGLWTNVAQVLATTFVLFNQCAAIRSKAFRKVDGFDERYKYMEDYDLPLRLSLEGPWVFIREPLVEWRQGSPKSYSFEAKANEILMKECELSIREVVLNRVKNCAEHRELQKRLKREVKRNGRELAIARLNQSHFPGTSQVVHLLKSVERCRNGIYRRTPSFPRMQVKSLAS